MSFATNNKNQTGVHNMPTEANLLNVAGLSIYLDEHSQEFLCIVSHAGGVRQSVRVRVSDWAMLSDAVSLAINKAVVRQ